MRTHTNVLIVPALIVAGLLAACNDPENGLPTKPSVLTLSSVDISGPALLAPGQSVQLVANAHMSDGTVKTAAGAGVVWSAIDAGPVQLSPTGVVTAGPQGGEAALAVAVTLGKTTRTASRTQLVLPNGTFRVVGSVKENESPNYRIIGARVEVTSGNPSVVTDGNGQYRLYGVPAVADIQVTGPGYVTQSRHVTLSANSTENFLLNLDGPRPDLGGNFTLAVDVTDSCPGARPLAAGLRHRTYDARMTQSGASLDVLLTEARFRLNSLGLGNRFAGLVLGGSATFYLLWYDSFYYPFYGPDSYPNIVEALPDGTYLVVSGEALLSGGPSRLAGTLTNAAIAQWDSRFPANSSSQVGLCFGNFQFSLTAK